MFSPDRYVEALRFAAERHSGQLFSGTELPYLVHVTAVAAEVIAALTDSHLDADLAVTCALLHDTVEDTAKTEIEKTALALEIANRFGASVRDGVNALSKRQFGPDGSELSKEEKIADSLTRIREQPHAVWAVKLADRITNLAPPPNYWTREKCAAYRVEGQLILDTLGGASTTLARRLRERIASYARYCAS